MSVTIDVQALMRPYLFIFEEFAGYPPKTVPGNACLDRDTGWTYTLAALDASQASWPVAPGGTTIAAQTAHALYYVEVITQGMEGDEPPTDWPGSFTPAEVDETSWEDLCERMRAGLDQFRMLVSGRSEWNEDQLGDLLGALAHTAYHLGAVRQIVRAIGSEPVR